MKNKTKIAILAVIIAAVILAVFFVYKKSSENKSATLSYPKDYMVLTADNADGNEELIKALGYSVTSFKKHLESKNAISMAINGDNSCQFMLTQSRSDFSSELNNLNESSDDQLQKIGETLMPNGFTGIYTLGDKVFLESETSVKDTENYTAVQLVTVISGKIYTLNYYVVGTSVKSALKTAEEVAGTLSVPKTFSLKNLFRVSGSTVYIIILGAVIIAGIISIVLLSISLIRDIKADRKRGEFREFHIKRRNRK